MGKKLEFTIERSERISTFLANAVPKLTRAKADLLVKSGEVRVNGVRVRSNAVLGVGDIVKVFVPDDSVKNALAANTVYEDGNIVVFDKPKRVAYDALPDMYGAPLFAVHRLDTNTTGVIVFAKTEHAQAELCNAFKERSVKKTYEAVVYPAPKDEKATLTAYTKLMPSQNLALVADEQKAGYKTMITEYEIIKRMGGGALVRIYLHTGRTHQIRAHFCHIGCPIVGEHKYGIKGVVAPDGAPDTQMLAAVSISFDGLKNGLEYLNGKVFSAPNGFDLRFLEEK